MNILFLSKNMSRYAGAFYQQDVMDEIARQHNVFFYGPGFPQYDENHTLQAILKMPATKPDIIIVGHTWLSDTPGATQITLSPSVDLSGTKIPKIILLNKEYVNLDKKLAYIKEQKFNLVFTHHHDAERYRKATGTPTHFLPFAVNMRRFVYSPAIPKDIDLFFSGILQNPYAPEVHDDIRIRIQKLLFHSLGQAYIKKRAKASRLALYWHTQATQLPDRILNRAIHGQEKLSDEDYVRMLNRSRLCLNSLSPMNLVGTRYFESMAMRSLVLCPESKHYNGLFSSGKHYVTFKDDLSDFIEKALHFTQHSAERNTITDAAFEHARDNHTWKHRVRHITDLAKEL